MTNDGRRKQGEAVRRSFPGIEPGSKPQISNSKLQRNLKQQAPKRSRALDLDAWGLVFLGSLEFGAWCFSPHSSTQHRQEAPESLSFLTLRPCKATWLWFCP